ncbi:hypothetical protein PFISCL1PPCAC_2155, partial [Pristionchus fissidentatus]
LRERASISIFYLSLHSFTILITSFIRSRHEMFDLSATPIFLFIPFVAFFLLFVIILALKICFSSLLVRAWIARILRRKKSSSAPQNSPVQTGDWRSPTSSTGSLEGIRTEGVGRVPAAAAAAAAGPRDQPQGYYAGMLPATETSGAYAMQVPNYTLVQHSTNSSSSIRDPRLFGGLAGIAAPPPYPPPPAYSQISNFPEMPGRNPSSSVPLPPTTCIKISEFPPVA